MSWVSVPLCARFGFLRQLLDHYLAYARQEVVGKPLFLCRKFRFLSHRLWSLYGHNRSQHQSGSGRYGYDCAVIL